MAALSAPTNHQLCLAHDLSHRSYQGLCLLRCPNGDAQIVAHLWQVSNGGLVNMLLTQEFSKRYTFTNP